MDQQEKTIFKLFATLIAKILPSQGQHTNDLPVWLIYLGQIAMIISCLVISLDQQETDKQLDIALLDQILMYLRIGLSIMFIITKFKLLLMLSNIVGIAILFCYKENTIMTMAVSAQAIAFVVYYYCKQQRNYNFDSRINLLPSVLISIIVHLIQFFTILASRVSENALQSNIGTFETPLNKNLFTISILTFLIYLLTKTIYFYKNTTANLFKSLSLGMFITTVTFIISFALNTKQISVYCGFFVFIFILSILWGKVRPVTYDTKVLFCTDYKILIGKDKLEYVKSLIFLIQHQQKVKIKAFLNFHYSRCKLIRCPVTYFLQQKKPQNQYKNCIQLLLKQVLERCYAENDFLFQLFLFYRIKYDDQYVKIIRNDNFCHIRQKNRVIQQNKKKDDLDLQIYNMEQDEEALIQVTKQFLTKYINFLQYLLSSRISLEICQKKTLKLLQLRQKITQFCANQNRISDNSFKLFSILKQRVFTFRKDEQQRQKLPQYVLINNSETPMLIVSAQIDSLGKILHSNASARSFLLYRQQEFKALTVNDLIPDHFRQEHMKILDIGSKRIEYDSNQRTISTLVFVKCSNGYCVVCKLRVHPLNGLKGKRWSVQLIPYKRQKSIMVVEDDGNIIAINQNSVSLGFSLEMIGYQIQLEILDRLNQQQSIILQPSQAIMEELEMHQNLRFQLILDQENKLKKKKVVKKNRQVILPHFNIIILTKERQDKPIMNLDPFTVSSIAMDINMPIQSQLIHTNSKLQLPSQNLLGLQLHNKKHSEQSIKSRLSIPGHKIDLNQVVDFSFDFDPKELKYVDKKQQIYQNCPGFVSLQQQTDPWVLFKRFINNNPDFGQDINEMIYIQGRLQFRENRVFQYEDQDWQSLRDTEDQTRIEQLKQIELQNFSQTMKQILSKKPPQLTALSSILCIGGIVVLASTIGILILSVVHLDLQKNRNTVQLLIDQRKIFFTSVGNQVIREYFQKQQIWVQCPNCVLQDFSQLYTIQGQLNKIFPKYQQIYNEKLNSNINQFQFLGEIQKDVEISMGSSLRIQSKITNKIVYQVLFGILPAIQQKKINSLDFIDNQIKTINMAKIIFISTACFVGLIVALGLRMFSKKVLQQRNRLFKIVATIQEEKIQILKFQLKDIVQNLDLYLIQDERDQRYYQNQQKNIQNNKSLTNKIKKKIIKDQSNPFSCLFYLIILGLGCSVLLLLQGKTRIQFSKKFSSFYFIFSPCLEQIQQIWLHGAYQYKMNLQNRPINYSAIKYQINKFQTNFKSFSQDVYYNKVHLKPEGQLRTFIFEVYHGKICQILQLYNSFCTNIENQYLTRSINQVAIQQILYLSKLFDGETSFDIGLSKRINQISSILITKLIKTGIGISKAQIQLEFKYSRQWIILMGIVLVSVEILVILVAICWINGKKQSIQEPLNTLVNLIPLQILLKNYEFKKWYYEKFKDSVY